MPDDYDPSHPFDVLGLLGLAVILLGVLRLLVERCAENVMGVWG